MTGETAGPKAAPKARSKPLGDLRAFVAAVQRDLPDVAIDRRDEEVAAFGEQACRGLAAGKKAPAVVREFRAQGVSSAQAKRLFALASNTVCP
ncbi:DUF732 domain-containing protein [Actinoplanes sp. CA-131856]